MVVAGAECVCGRLEPPGSASVAFGAVDGSLGTKWCMIGGAVDVSVAFCGSRRSSTALLRYSSWSAKE